MKVAVICPFPEYFAGTLAEHGDETVILGEADMAYERLKNDDIDAILVCGCERRIPSDIISSEIKCINVHFSILPYGRGPEPLLSSIVNGEPTGVTVFRMTDETDAGPIIGRKEFPMDPGCDTLRQLMDRAFDTAASLIKEIWGDIRAGRCCEEPQTGRGSSHDSKDADRIFGLAVGMSGKPVNEFLEKAGGIVMGSEIFL